MRRSSNDARVALAALVIAAGLGTTAPARATDDSADAHLRAGLALRREHKNLEALEEFRQAYVLAPTPQASAQIGLAEQALALWIDAEVDLQVALSAKDDEWIARNREPIEAALRTIDDELGWLTVAASDPQAMIALDGTALGKGSWNVRIPVGVHDVLVSAAQATGPVHQNIQVSAHEHVRVVVLVPPPVAVPATLGATATAVSGPLEPIAMPGPTPQPAQRIAGYTAGALGVAGLATSFVLGGLALHERAVVDAHCADKHCDSQGLAAGQVGPSLATGSTIAFAAGVVSLGAGTALVLTAPSPHATHAPSSGMIAVRLTLP
jgi:hypothetical protein